MAAHHDQEVDYQLPDRLPLFPLRNALLLPRGRLPLNIFEPRYLLMTDQALGQGRLIGMVRPRTDTNVDDLYPIGCVGRITSFMETDDRRYLITLTGVSRFIIREELTTDTSYRVARPDWEPFSADLWENPEAETASTREKLLHVLNTYLNEAGLKADWNTIEEASVESIVNSIASSCPFNADEQQAILEATTIDARAKALISLMEISVAENQTDILDQMEKPDRLQ